MSTTTRHDQSQQPDIRAALLLAARALAWILLVRWAHDASPTPLAVFVYAGVLGDVAALALIGIVSLPRHALTGSVHGVLGVAVLIWAVDLTPLATLMGDPGTIAIAFVGFMLGALVRGVGALVRYFLE